MIKCDSCGDISPYDATFCIGCGKILPDGTAANTGATIRLYENIKLAVPYSTFVESGTGPHTPVFKTKEEPLYFIYKAELGALLKNSHVALKEIDTGYDIYYHGRRVVFMD